MARSERGGPTFICVGPEKTGTTWLFRNLASHPDVFLAPPKETRFFFEHFHAPGEGAFSRLVSTSMWYKRHYRRYLLSRLAHYARSPKLLVEPWRLMWDWRYVFSVHDDEWYLRAFDVPGRYRVTGEISPPYFFMPEEAVDHAARLVPHARIVLFLRNPVDWCWSFARMKILRNRAVDLSTANPKEFSDFFSDAIRYYSFSGALSKWRRRFPPEQIYVGFFDRLFEAPTEVHAELCAFIGLDRDRTPQAVLDRLSRRVNVGVEAELPLDFASMLARHYLADVEALAREFPVYPQRWLAGLEALAAEPVARAARI